MVLDLYGWTGWRREVGRLAGPRYPAVCQPRILYVQEVLAMSESLEVNDKEVNTLLTLYFFRLMLIIMQVTKMYEYRLRVKC